MHDAEVLTSRCDQADVEKERGAVLEEWRMSRDSSGRTQEAQFKFMLAGSKVYVTKYFSMHTDLHCSLLAVNVL